MGVTVDVTDITQEGDKKVVTMLVDKQKITSITAVEIRARIRALRAVGIVDSWEDAFEKFARAREIERITEIRSIKNVTDLRFRRQRLRAVVAVINEARE